MRNKVWILSLACAIIISCGITKVSTEVLNKSQVIRDNAKVKIVYSKNPFNFQIENDKYIFYINKQLLINIQDKYNDIVDNFRFQ